MLIVKIQWAFDRWARAHRRFPQHRDYLTDAALDLIAQAGFDPVYGARPLKRAVQQQIENPLAQRILGGQFMPNDTILIDVVESKLTFATQAA